MKEVVTQQWSMKKSYEFTLLGDKLSGTGECQGAVTARTRFVWVMFSETMYCVKKFPSKLKVTINNRYVKLSIPDRNVF